MLKLDKVARDVDMPRDLPMPKYEYQSSDSESYVYPCRELEQGFRKDEQAEPPRLQNVTLVI